LPVSRRGFIGAALAASATLPSRGARAAYPERPVRLIVPFAAGGAVDSVARVLGKALTANLGGSIVIDNRGGAGGVIGMEAVAHAAADGYTLLLSHSGFAAMPGLYRDLPFDPVRDFAGVVTAASGAYVLAVNSAEPFTSVVDLIAYAKANPGRLTYGSAGAGSIIHLAGEFFKRTAAVELVHVPYKGAAPALQDVIAGHVDMMFATAASVVAHIRDGQVRALAVTTPTRTAVMPELATVDELGLKGFDATTWHGLVVPAKTPKDIVSTLHRATVAALNDAGVKKQLGDLGVDIVGSTPESFAAYIKAEIPKWTAIIKASGAKLD